jgi:hypothetical protein
MIGFLFGLAAGVILGFLLGVIAVAGSKMGREADRVFTESDFRKMDPDTLRVVSHFEDQITQQIRPTAGVRVCSCIGWPPRRGPDGPHFVDPDCPFHGGAA